MSDYNEERIDLQYYFRVLQKRRWTIATVAAVVFLATLLYSFAATPVFRATSSIVIEKENPNLVSVQEVMAVDATGSDYYQTQYKIIESRSVAREVIRRLNLLESPEFFPPPRDHFLANARRWLVGRIEWWGDRLAGVLRSGEPVAAVSEFAEESEAEKRLIGDFIERIDVSPIRNSRLVEVSFEGRMPALTAQIANELVRTYIDQTLDTKLQAAKNAVQWLSERIDEERSKVEEAENALLRYKEENQIITDFSSDAEQITAQKLAQINAQVVEAEAKRVEAETRYRQALALENQPDLLDSIPEVLSNELIREIKKMEVNLYNRMSELSKKYGKRHPQMLALESELKELKKRKGAEIKLVISSMRSNYKIALAREESLKQALEAQKQNSFDMNQKAVQYGVLRRQAESTRNMYELLMKRFKETTLAEEMKTGNIRVIDRAEIPAEPVKPRKKLNLLLAIVVGLTLGVGMAFTVEALDNTIKIPDDVKQGLGIPFLGAVPIFDPPASRNGVSPDLITVHSPRNPASESYRTIRTGILLSSADKTPQVILVTSGGPGEGKTACAANLAVAMAQAGEQAGSRVLLIDCDMRRPRIHNVFGVEREPGMSTVLIGSTAFHDAIAPTGYDNLDVVPCGPLPPNPSEILGSRKMKRFIEVLRKRYHRIVIDSPPITPVTDAVLLSQVADGVVMVIRAGETPRPLVEICIEQMQTAKAHILGAALNGVDIAKDGYYYYQYTYYYGEDGKRRKRSRRKKSGNAPASPAAP